MPHQEAEEKAQAAEEKALAAEAMLKFLEEQVALAEEAMRKRGQKPVKASELMAKVTVAKIALEEPSQDSDGVGISPGLEGK